MKTNKGVLIVIIAVLLTGLGLGGLSIANYNSGNKEFVGDGFILKPSDEVNVLGDVNEQYYFSQGDTYREKYGSHILFRDQNGEEVNLPNTQFIHYADGSLGSFTKGVIMDISDLNATQFGYYNLTKNTILLKDGSSYSITSRGETMKLEEFVWKISDTDYLFVSPEVTFQLNDSISVTLPNYAQIKYIDNGIVRIVHEQGTYQTISEETMLVSEGGAELNLVGKSFYKNGEPTVYLNEMSMNDESYTLLDENAATPEIKIPTFQVINGKNGAPGENGENGADGENGEDGEVGEDGEDGVSGAGGSAGGAGTSGENGEVGEDGEEGQNGINGTTGYDGDDGDDGDDASNAFSQTGVMGVHQNVRPNVSLDPSSFAITPGSANLQLHMDDPNQALVQGTLSLKVYDRASMQEVSISSAYASQFENSGNVSVNVGGLKADTEYLLIVAGQYYSDPDNLTDPETIRDVNFYTKIFKTDKLGLELNVAKVTDDKVVVAATKSSDAIASYNVLFYYYDEDNNLKELAYYPNLEHSEGALEFSVDQPGPTTRYAEFDAGVKSNSLYYARITNASMQNGALVDNTGDTEIEIRTLKKMPKTSTGSLAITQIQPDLIANQRNRTLTLSMPALSDPDNGIMKYRYQLFKNDEVVAAAIAGTFNSLVPAYEEETDSLKDFVFQLPGDELSEFVGRIVVVFDDNQKQVEYKTEMSFANRLVSDAFPVAEIIPLTTGGQISTHQDVLEGYVKVTDAAGMLLEHINATNPLVMTITNEYDDILTLNLYNEAVTPGSTEKTKFYYFKKDGLRKETMYTLSVSGPVDANANGTLEAPEATTYITGLRTPTLATAPLLMVYSVANSPAAFAIRVNMAPALGTTDLTTPNTDFYEYEADALNRVDFELVQTIDGREKILGTSHISDPYDLIAFPESGNHKSIFKDGGWVSLSSVSYSSTANLTGYTTMMPNTAGDDKLILTPGSFGLSDSLFSGGEYTIRAVSATDYTKHKNEVGFDSSVHDGSSVTFTVAKQHITDNPFNQVDYRVIYNNDADPAHYDMSLDRYTPVGLTIRAKYLNSDVKSITYKIWKLDSDQNNPDYIGPEPSVIYSSESNPANIPAGALVDYGTLVKTVTVSDLAGDAGKGFVDDFDLYFADNNMERGYRYYISYSIVSSIYSGIDCDRNGLDDIYPNCRYSGATDAIPLYRSKVIELEKQTPMIIGYLDSTQVSGTKGVTWKYEIDDPDKALTSKSDDDSKIMATVQISKSKNALDMDAAKTTTIYLDRAAYKNYNDLVLTETTNKLTNFCYYKLKFTYNLMEGDFTPVQEKETIPILYRASSNFTPSTSQDKMIKIIGKPVTSLTPASDKDPLDATHEKAVLNMGGYMYRITVRGEDIYKYAAFRVEFTGKSTMDGQNYSVIYDPVYPDIQEVKITDLNYAGSSTLEYPYAYLYVDTGAVKDLRDVKGVEKATIKVTGYYSTGNQGFGAFTLANEYPIGHEGTSLKERDKFFLSIMDDVGGYEYLTYDGNNRYITGKSDSTYKYAAGSLFTPGADISNGGNGFDRSNYMLSMSYIPTPITLDGGASVIQEYNRIGIGIDGISSSSIYSSDVRLMVEKAAEKEITIPTKVTKEVSLSDIIPAVSYDIKKTSPGAQSFVANFNLAGTGATSETKIYAILYEKLEGSESYSPLKTEITTRAGADGETILLLSAPAVAAGDGDRYATDMTYFDKANYESNSLDIFSTSKGTFYTVVRAQNLKTGTNYKLQLFTYDSADQRMLLYDKDYKLVGMEYEVRTKDNVSILVSDPSYDFANYADKSARFGFAVSGDEGTGLEVEYMLADAAGFELWDNWKKLAPIGSGYLAYYSWNMEDNNRMRVDLTPAGVVQLNTNYRLLVNVKSEAGECLLAGGQPLVKTFKTPATLRKPTMYLQASNYIDSVNLTSGIRVDFRCTDQNAAIRGPETNAENANYQAKAFHVSLTKALSGQDVTERYIDMGVRKDAEDGASYILTSAHLTFPDLEPGVLYNVRISAPVDRNNDGIAEDEVYIEQQIQVSSLAKCSLGANAANIPQGGTAGSPKVTVFMSERENFEDVAKIVMTVFKDGIQKDTTTITYTDTDEEIYSYSWNWSGITKEGIYKIMLQYQDSSGNMLGNGDVNVEVTK